ncbi:histone-lysine N-methyltransferase, H3 lysine-79 specific isoform X4 [Photinus pyralis]|uniref:histone-lysine N-methyltransferase, H3 lysine-79 specific isoform X4 n=1 Tax=Photinus pyralis TaxID=7054 RepID=UPI0012675ABE|nr:histone-lysine N-methyltransferase, H3 lysine-79 specific isoform X4 [Photinus pyralis]
MLTVLRPRELTPMEGLDHLFLLPERVLEMDTKNLQKDLAGLDFDARLLHEAPMGNVWLCTMHWFAHLGSDSSNVEDEKEARIKTFKERQNEERQRKLDEMKHQALAAQRFKEQKENERRQRIDDLRLKEDERRQQVEDRKKAINDAERDRLESILKRNQEREARIEAKRKNERSSMVFAFGSSTPRMLGPADSSGSFWGHRRATSTQNITYSPAPLTRRQSERELDGGSKKRATSAGGLERSGEDMRMSTSMYAVFHWDSDPDSFKSPITSLPAQPISLNTTSSFATTPQHPAGCISGYVGRRRTDLMPTIPAKDSPTTLPRKPFMRSPGRAYSMSRLDQLSKPRKRPTDLPTLTEMAIHSPFKSLYHPQQSSVSRSMSHLAFNKPAQPVQSQKPLRKADSRSMHQLTTAVSLPPPRTTRATELRQKKLASTNCFSQVEAPSRPSSSLSQQSTSSVTSSVVMRSRPSTAPRGPRPASIAVTGITTDLKNLADIKKPDNKPPLPKVRKSSLVKSQEKIGKKKSLSSPTEGSPKTLLSPTSTATATITTDVDITNTLINVDRNTTNFVSETISNEDKLILNGQECSIESDNKQTTPQLIQIDQIGPTDVTDQLETKFNEMSICDDEKGDAVKDMIYQIIDKVEENIFGKSEPSAVPDNQLDMFESQSGDIDMTASVNSKPRITTEEEAKAALAERRRLAREEAERQAEMERLRIEEEIRIEYERQQREEELQRQLIEQQRAAEEERLREAIKEAQRREEEEKLRKEEELRLKVLKDEAERKAREEAERQKAELQERLKNEEKEREARRKRVEAIMLRTRGKNNSGVSQTEEKNAENKFEVKVNGSKTDSAENGHKNGKDIETVDNIIPVDTLKNANTVNVTTLSTDDTINSNDAWQRNSQTDLLM